MKQGSEKRYPITLAGKFYKMTIGTTTTVTGNKAKWDEEAKGFRYVEGKELLSEVGRKPCPKCGKNPDDYGGHDPCIANLPGVNRACCGHGVHKGEIFFENGIKIRGWFDEIIKSDVLPRSRDEETE